MRFTFVHAADLHLDAVLPPLPEAGDDPGRFVGQMPSPQWPVTGSLPAGNRPGQRGPYGPPADLAGFLRAAPFLALRRLVDLCLESGAAFLLLSGDVFDGRGGSLKARLELRDAVRELGAAGVQVFWARGNHDPLETKDGPGGDAPADAVAWPDNLKIFSSAGNSFLLPWGPNGPAEALPLPAPAPAAPAEPGKLTADNAAGPADFSAGAVILHGISHRTAQVRENLALRLRDLAASGKPPGLANAFQIGVLHCAVGGSAEGHENYAPCALGDLDAGPDYWALGHIHVPLLLSAHPHAAYPGSLQGLHVKESGPRGCILATVNGSSLERLSFVPLAPVRWERISLNLSAGRRLPGPPGDDGSAAAGKPAGEFGAEGFGGGLGEEPGDELGGLAGEDLDGLEDLILASLEERAASLPGMNGFGSAPAGDPGGSLEYPPQLLLFRLELKGRSRLDALLRREGALEDLRLRLNAALTRRAGGSAEKGEKVAVRVKDIRLHTSPDIDLEALLAGDNLLAETIRGALRLRELCLAPAGSNQPGRDQSGKDRLSKDQVAHDQLNGVQADRALAADARAESGQPDSLRPAADSELLEFCRNTLDGLFQHPQIRRLRAVSSAGAQGRLAASGQGGGAFLELDAADLAALAEEAAAICLELFEVRE